MLIAVQKRTGRRGTNFQANGNVGLRILEAVFFSSLYFSEMATTDGGM